MSCLQNGCWRIRDDSGKPFSTVPAIEILALHFLDLRMGRVNPYAQSVKTSAFIAQPLDVYEIGCMLGKSPLLEWVHI